MLDNTKKQTLVEVRNLKKVFNAGRADEIIAIDNISFDIYEGEIFGLVGESGSGKSTTGRTLIKLEDMSSGKVRYKGENIEEIKGQRDLLAFRKSMQMIFQDPYASLNPRMTVNEIVGGPMDVHNLASSRHDRQERVNRLLERVGLNATYANRYPREFSGGQAQRVGIARALAVQPEFIIADEPISALDVSIQAQVVNLLMDLKKDYNLTYLFIAHDLSMVRFISDRIGVMKNGQILEISPANELYRAPVHPYTQSLLSAIPVADPTLDQQRKDYDESIQEYTEEEQDVRLHEIGPEHYVYCSAAEVPQYTAVYEQMMTSV